ncbi:hypothetical protein C1706_04790 [Propioniciclava flava]|uniref:Uncharacterized protein n=1 Tax=Propioniciclava flava TaxID=2072026 RepID=A0A4Q2EIQ1_9ACTN|nr:hypothetical protein C1706_04790 [Propioniciclava flava]
MTSGPPRRTPLRPRRRTDGFGRPPRGGRRRRRRTSRGRSRERACLYDQARRGRRRRRATTG